MHTTIDLFTKYIDDEFNRIRKNLKIHLEDKSDIRVKRRFLSSHVPRKVITSSEILLDTVINALMDEARSQLKGASVELQNKFYDHNFRQKIKEWTLQIENKLSLEPEYIKYSSDPQMVYGLVSGGVTFTAGAVITSIVFVPMGVIGTIVGGLVTLILSAAAFKIAYDKAEPKAFSKIKEDIESYLEGAKKQITDWLSKVILAFQKEFKSFCMNNGWGSQ